MSEPIGIYQNLSEDRDTKTFLPQNVINFEFEADQIKTVSTKISNIYVMWLITFQSMFCWY